VRAYPDEQLIDRENRHFDASETPVRSMRQRMDALDRANEIRSYRAQLKRDLKAGRANVIDILTNSNPMIDTMKIFDLMLAVPKMGRTKVNKMLISCRISPSKTIAGLSDRQRDELLLVLRRRS
jgi:hypothetical protein